MYCKHQWQIHVIGLSMEIALPVPFTPMMCAPCTIRACRSALFPHEDSCTQKDYGQQRPKKGCWKGSAEIATHKGHQISWWIDYKSQAPVHPVIAPICNKGCHGCGSYENQTDGWSLLDREPSEQENGDIQNASPHT